jgi:hypothetical protein
MKSVTKAVIKKRVSNLLSTWPLNLPIGESDFQLLIGILKDHPDYKQKVGIGVRDIVIQTNPVYKNRGFYILRKDGSQTDFSYRQCLNPASNKQKFLNACRVAIMPQILQFKETFFGTLMDQEYFCPLSGEKITELNCHIDHKPPNTFKKIIEDFISMSGIDQNTVKIDGAGVDGCVKDTLEDKVLEQRWQAYHGTNCNLRVVSKNARH